jgi:hypothetical protein
MIGVSFTKERSLKLYARVNETGVSKVWTFLNSNGTAHNISSYNFKLVVKLRASTVTNLFVLTIGSGLTVQGVSSNELLIELTQANLTRDVGTNFWTLFSIAENKTWLNGAFFFHNGEFDGVEESDEIIIGATSTVNITVNGDSDTTENIKYKGLWSGTVALPATALTGWIYKFEFDCVVPYLGGDVTYQAGSLAMALTDNSGSPGNWYQL